MKMLFILNVANRINSFSHASMRAACEMEIEYHIAGNWGYTSDAEKHEDEEKYGIRIHQIDFVRVPYDSGNRRAYHQLLDLVEREGFDVIHCNTPIGGVLGRLAGKKCKVKKVIYQAHGLHFYKGAPIINWLIYYPIERWLARYTDALITINQEDYQLAKEKMRLRDNGKVYYVPGVGIDTAQFRMEPSVRSSKRQELGLSDSDIMVISAGELNRNKNNAVILSALSKQNNKNIHYFLCGIGDKERKLRQQAEKAGITQQIRFLGYRQDLKELLQVADIFVMPSFREGLARSVMEAMASGLPCIVSKIRGNVDLIQEGEGGFLCGPTDVDGFAKAIAELAQNALIRQKMGCFNLNQIEKFDSAVIEKEIAKIYATLINS